MRIGEITDEGIRTIRVVQVGQEKKIATQRRLETMLFVEDGAMTHHVSL